MHFMLVTGSSIEKYVYKAKVCVVWKNVASISLLSYLYFYKVVWLYLITTTLKFSLSLEVGIFTHYNSLQYKLFSFEMINLVLQQFNKTYRVFKFEFRS